MGCHPVDACVHRVLDRHTKKIHRWPSVAGQVDVCMSHWDDRVCIRSCICMFAICLFLRCYALYVCLHPFPFSLSSQHVQDAWYEDGFQLEECCCKVCPAHGMVRTSRVSLEFWYWYVCCLSLRMVIHRTIGQGCNRSASFRALALQLIERPTTLHQDKRCDLLMFIFLFGKALVWRQGDVGHEALCGACLDAPWRLRAVEHDGYQYSCVHKHDSRMKAHTDSYSHSNTAIFPCVHCTAASGDIWSIR